MTPIDSDNREALRRLLDVPLVWRRLRRADSALGLLPRELLHAGPPFSGPPPEPVIKAACAALIFEGEADSEPSARTLLAAGHATLAPAQDRHLVTPLAAVVSRSMWLHEVGRPEAPAWSPLNEGAGPAQRFGILSAAVVERLGFVHGELAAALNRLGDLDLDLLGPARRGLAAGDELHARLSVPSAALAQALAARGLEETALAFFHDNQQSFLNPWMAACKAMMRAAASAGQGDLLVAAGGNGVEFGIQRAGHPGRWLSAPVEAPAGPALSAHLASARRLPAIGDSAVIDAIGLGASALDAAPEQAGLLTPAQVAESREAARRALLGDHPGLGRPLGLSAGRVAPGARPGVCLAALDADGEHGLVGRGLAFHPATLYTNRHRS